MPRPGDILLVRDYDGPSDVLGELIMAGERARYGDSDEARWTHCALILDADGTIAEALEEGVKLTNLQKYARRETLIISPPPEVVTDAQRALACEFARQQVDTKYDVLDFIALAGSLLTGLDLSLHSDRRFICSGLVARATEKYVASYPYPSEQMMPADLQVYWHGRTGEPLPPRSLPGRLLDKLRVVTRAVCRLPVKLLRKLTG